MSTTDLSQPLPKLVAVDLDYTLWPCWVDTHIRPPLAATAKADVLIDRAGRAFSFFAEVPHILATLRSAGVKLAACSRTHRPDMCVCFFHSTSPLGLHPHSFLKKIRIHVQCPTGAFRSSDPSSSLFILH